MWGNVLVQEMTMEENDMILVSRFYDGTSSNMNGWVRGMPGLCIHMQFCAIHLGHSETYLLRPPLGPTILALIESANIKPYMK